MWKVGHFYRGSTHKSRIRIPYVKFIVIFQYDSQVINFYIMLN